MYPTSQNTCFLRQLSDLPFCKYQLWSSGNFSNSWVWIESFLPVQIHPWLVVEPTHLNNMLVKLETTNQTKYTFVFSFHTNIIQTIPNQIGNLNRDEHKKIFEPPARSKYHMLPLLVSSWSYLLRFAWLPVIGRIFPCSPSIHAPFWNGL